MRYDLEILECGLMLCNIKIVNPYCREEEVTCKGLIDTGSDRTIVAKELFSQFKKIEHIAIKTGTLSTLEKNEEIKTYPFLFYIPINNLYSSDAIVGIKEFPESREYEVIFGIDVLKRFSLSFSRSENVAYLKC